MSRIYYRNTILFALCFVSSYSASIMAETPVTGTKNNTPQEINLPAERSPSFVFTNKTGALICDFVITVHTGAALTTGAVIDDLYYPRGGGPAEDWDVDDDRNGTLDAGETTAGPEPGGAGGLAHADNTQPANRQIRIEETGVGQCVQRNRNFDLTLTFDRVPAAGDKIRIQPTNARRRNLYAWVGGIDEEQQVAMLSNKQLHPTFSVAGSAEDVLVSALRLSMLTSGVKIIDIATTPVGEVHLDDGIVSFEQPVSAAEGFMVEGTLSGFGVISIKTETITSNMLEQQQTTH